MVHRRVDKFAVLRDELVVFLPIDVAELCDQFVKLSFAPSRGETT